MASITLTNIQKSFGSTVVLKDTNLDIVDGEFLTLVGPSGCGKSTLLRIIAGLEAQDRGDVVIGSKVVNDVRASRRDLAMVFQSYALYPHMTVEQNLATPLHLRDLTFTQRLPIVGRFLPGYSRKKRKINAAISGVAETLQIEHLLDRKPGQLSGGQRQRVAVGRAMVRDPAAFLMDEPLSNLDAALRVHMRAELSALHRSLGTTFVYVTHDQAEALTMSTRMAVMMDGEILQIGGPESLYGDPHDLRVAQFVGSPKINTVSGEADDTGRLFFLGVDLNRRTADSSVKQVTIGLRPEHLTVKHQMDEGTFVGKLTYIENLGSEAFLHITAGVDEATLIVRADPADAQGKSVDDRVFVAPRFDKAMAFDAKGRRLELTVAESRAEVA